jgi:hypothetical protein
MIVPIPPAHWRPITVPGFKFGKLLPTERLGFADPEVAKL